MAEQITFPNDPPQAGDQFTVGNTTFAWDGTPGLWRAFTTASSSNGGEVGTTFYPTAWGADGTAPTIVNANASTSYTATEDIWFWAYGSGTPQVGDNNIPPFGTITNTSGNSWIQLVAQSANSSNGTGGVAAHRGFLANGDSFNSPSRNNFTLSTWPAGDLVSAGASTTVNIGSVITVDQSYNAASTNPQSGTAVAAALATVGGGGLGGSSTAASLVLSNNGSVQAGLYYFRSSRSLSVTGDTVSGQAWAMQDTGGGGQDLLLADVVTSAGDGLSISGGNVNSIAGTITGWVQSDGTINFVGTSPVVYQVG